MVPSMRGAFWIRPTPTLTPSLCIHECHIKINISWLVKRLLLILYVWLVRVIKCLSLVVHAEWSQVCEEHSEQGQPLLWRRYCAIMNLVSITTHDMKNLDFMVGKCVQLNAEISFIILHEFSLIRFHAEWSQVCEEHSKQGQPLLWRRHCASLPHWLGTKYLDPRRSGQDHVRFPGNY